MISKFQELQIKQTEENKKELEVLKSEYEKTIAKLNELNEQYKRVEYLYSIEADRGRNILLKRELRNLEDEIIELNNKVEDMEAKKVELKFTNVDYSIEDIIKDLNKYLKANKVSSYNERLIKAKQEYMMAIENLYSEAKEVHKEVQSLKNSMVNNYSSEELEQYNIRSINDLISHAGKVDYIKIKVSDKNLMNDISIVLNNSHYESKIKHIFSVINSI